MLPETSADVEQHAWYLAEHLSSYLLYHYDMNNINIYIYSHLHVTSQHM